MGRNWAFSLSVIVVLTIGGHGLARSYDNNRDHSRWTRPHIPTQDDLDLVKAALKRGDILPIARILSLVAQYLPGDMVEVKLETRRGRLDYEIKVLVPSGHVRKLVLDGGSGAIVELDD